MIIKFTSSGMDSYSRYAGATINVKTMEKSNEISIRQGEPEDAMFGRDLPSPKVIVKMLEQAYQAGKNGEELTIKEEHE